MNEHNLEPVRRLSRDIAASAVTLSADEARFLVDAYYIMQANHLERTKNLERAIAPESTKGPERALVIKMNGVRE